MGGEKNQEKSPNIDSDNISRISNIRTNILKNYNRDLDFQNYKIENADEIHIIKEILCMTVITGGKNISTPLKKVILAARALLIKPKIMFMDENAIKIGIMDISYNYTALWKSLNNTTVLAVLNNWDAILRFDKVLYMTEGRIREFGDPRELISKYGSYLRMKLKTNRQAFDKITDQITKIEKNEDNGNQNKDKIVNIRKNILNDPDGKFPNFNKI